MMNAVSTYAAAPTLATEATRRSEPRSATVDTPAAEQAQPGPTKPATVVFNPRSRFDSEAGVFVMEFRSTRTGEIERRFPDEQQLKAYRQAAQAKAGGGQGQGQGQTQLV